MNAKINYELYRIVSLDRRSALRLLAEIKCAPEVDRRSGTWVLEKPVAWINQTKRFRLAVENESSGRLLLTVQIDSEDRMQAVKEFLGLILDADGGLPGNIRKSLTPTAPMLRQLGTGYYRCRHGVDFIDLMDCNGMSMNTEFPDFPCLISVHGLEVKRVTSIGESDLLTALAALTGHDYVSA